MDVEIQSSYQSLSERRYFSQDKILHILCYQYTVKARKYGITLTNFSIVLNVILCISLHVFELIKMPAVKRFRFDDVLTLYSKFGSIPDVGSWLILLGVALIQV